MSTLTNTKIKDTYDGLLKKADSTTGLPATGLSVIEDGVGNASALLIGRSGQGVRSDSDLSVIGDANLNGQLQVDQDANFDATVTTGNSSKVGIRTTSPNAALDVNGAIKTNSLNVNTKHIFTYTTAGNLKAVQMSGYGDGDFMNLGAETFTQPRTNTAFSGSGNIVEESAYAYYIIRPSFWETNQNLPANQPYYDYTLFTPVNTNEFIQVDEIMWVNNIQIAAGDPPVQRGGYVGAPGDIYMSIYSQSGTEATRRQLCMIPLGTYYNEIGKWSFIQRSSETVELANAFRTRVQRAGSTIRLRTARLNVYDSGGNYVGPTRPNFSSLLRVKYRRFQANELFADNQSTVLN